MLLLGIMGDITKGDVLRYILTPQIVPRLNAFYRAGFSNLAYMIALIYRGVGILPRGHRILTRDERKNISIRGVMAAAAAELKFDRKHIDQVVIYFAILLGLVLLALQFILAAGYFMMNPAFAQSGMPTNYAGFFSTPNYKEDVAYMLLFSVFGVPELFHPGATLSPFHVAIHSLFQFYSIGLLVIAVIIVCYYIFAVVAETAETGVPFGKRYNHVWTPIRLVVALGLLVPTGYGLNSGQWIALYAAKFGSDFASRGWSLFNQTMKNSYLNDPGQRVGVPQTPALTDLAAFMMVVSACEYAYENMGGLSNGSGVTNNNTKKIEAYVIKSSATSAAPETLSDALAYNNYQDIFGSGDMLIRFGEFNATVHTKYRGNVLPYCGELIIHTSDVSEPGANAIQSYYIQLVEQMYTGSIQKQEAEKFIQKYASDPSIRQPNIALPQNDFKASLTEQLRKDATTEIANAVKTQANSPTWKADAIKMANRGWGGAGIWYNKIAQINGSLVTAVANIPQKKMDPAVMEYVKREQAQQNTKTPEQHKTELADGKAIQFPTVVDAEVAKMLSRIYDYWRSENADQSADGNKSQQTNNIFIDTINLIFGTRGLFNMCANADVHPLVQLSILGKGMIEATIRNLGAAMFAGGIAALQIPFIGIAAGAAASIMLSVASITLTMGFLLFYVVPFMPFLYFFFAVGGWVKGLFEAMIGVPLWALAHLRIDGEGLPGDAAMNGYYLIFEIFLRPILIIFGLLASVVIFAALVKVLNEIFTLVVTNLSGHDYAFKTLCGKSISGTPSTDPMSVFRGPIDELFFTVMYAIIVYMIGMSCFKLIDLVPNNILRYMGASVETFNDAQTDPADGLMFRLSAGTSVVSSKLFGIAGGAGKAAGSALQGVQEGMKQK